MQQNGVLEKAGSKQTITIDKRTNLSRAEFIREYVDKSLPVVLTDAAKNWPAMGKHTPEFYKQNYSHIVKTIDGVTYTMAEAIDRILVSTAENRAPYPFNFDIKKVFPELMPDFSPQLVYGKSDRINSKLMPQQMLAGTTVHELFLGGNGSSFPYLHYDALFMHTQITQLFGSKIFFMYPPSQTPNMYPYPDNPKFSQINFLNPDYEKFPLYKEVEPIIVHLLQGETLFFPSGWWHTTQLNTHNWNNFINDRYVNWKKKISFMAAPVLAYGAIVGAIMNTFEL
jgi:hypothetical protein